MCLNGNALTLLGQHQGENYVLANQFGGTDKIFPVVRYWETKPFTNTKGKIMYAKRTAGK